MNAADGEILPQPFLMMLQDVPESKEVPAHQHIDFIYLAEVVGGKLLQNMKETSGIQWFSVDEIKALAEKELTFSTTPEIVEQITKLLGVSTSLKLQGDKMSRQNAIFIAATGQNVGKTTLCLGMLAALKKRYSSVGFIKPVGQLHVKVDDDVNVDKDVVLFKKYFHLPESWEDMSPVIVPPASQEISWTAK